MDNNYHYSPSGFGMLPAQEDASHASEESEIQYAEKMEGELVCCAMCGEQTQAFLVNYVLGKGFYCFECI